MNGSDRSLLLRLQDGVPLVDEPYRAIAEELGMTETEVIARTRDLLSQGVVRRFAVRIDHRKAGIRVNAMVAWRVPPGDVARAAEVMARFSEVTHCYERAVAPGRWEYNLFVVLHGRRREEVDRDIARLSGATGLDDYAVLVSTRELKRAPPGRALLMQEGSL
ncbi:Lrp/AsnC family transcriptional regulator [Methanoculleus sp. Wushi-C6]|uniref:siroheme decarboxylase n=1 Tax=Methanoculleus caldifontis TaxID=2651577 RepID=A0ABU3X330_9EURY|nr:AsnC family transcriptional regulator [Methanoculleus sp. Wushi-C6]MDV2482470.1 Lrp/AsnC family transcriptional regulator [Methanoculleus sp. Wushi-C6]